MKNVIDEIEMKQFSLNVREKRIGSVFKALCVIASFAGVIFVELAPELKTGLTNVFILEVSILAFLLPLIVCLLLYIFHEAAGFKIDEDVSKQRYKPEEAYEDIFDCIRFSGYASLFFGTLALSFLSFLRSSAWVLQVLFIVSAAYTAAYSFSKSLHSKTGKCFNFISGSVMVISIFLLTGLHH